MPHPSVISAISGLHHRTGKRSARGGVGIAFIVSATVPPHLGSIRAGQGRFRDAGAAQTVAIARQIAQFGRQVPSGEIPNPDGLSLSDRLLATHCPVGFLVPPTLPGATGRSETMFSSRRVVASSECVSPQGRDGTALLSPAAASVLPRAFGRGASFGEMT